ncbi:hypothetical protein CGMCC3_g18018 [Colletotrichum fructicola]|nr:uncharacterized protein CGMCC3_g18018 [Colletotrichum fructicola]KAE9565800.1 hypothetical protein CGMCC3_g18018 [Colletotrichum fructicola]
MSAPSNFWTLPLEVEFHQTIASLRHLTEIPSEPRAYHGHATSLGSHAHTLSIEDEIRTADSFAFLAHHEEGNKFVSTVTLREHSEGLQVVLASNTTPSPSVLGELMEITNRLSKLSRESGPKQAATQELLDVVLRFSSTRNLGRLRPPWVRQPRHFKTRQLCLQHRLQRQPQAFVRHSMEPDALRNALKTIVISCSQVARLGSTNSVEEHLKSVGVQIPLAESPEIRQVDKLARYFFACRDLARVAGKPQNRPVFKNIDVKALEPPSGAHRPGYIRVVKRPIPEVLDDPLRYASRTLRESHRILHDILLSQ